MLVKIRTELSLILLYMVSILWGNNLQSAHFEQEELPKKENILTGADSVACFCFI